MIIDISGIRDVNGASISVKLDEVLSLPLRSSDENINTCINGDVTVFNTGDHIRVHGHVSTDVSVDCDRCLTNFSYHIMASVDDRYYDKNTLTAEKKDLFEEQAIPFRVYEGEKLDISSSIIEALLLEVPIKLVCKEDCQGLCPACGQNLNDGNCSCEIDGLNPRMLKLQELLKIKKSDK